MNTTAKANDNTDASTTVSANDNLTASVNSYANVTSGRFSL